jgi:hypothetical protein
MGNASTLAGLLLLFGAATATPTHAQTTTVDGSYQKLSSGNGKIARALFEAQVVPPTTASTTASTARPGGAASGTPAPKPLSLDQIAAMKQGGQSWGQIFNMLKTQALVHDKNLGQVVSRYQRQQRPTTAGVVTTAASRASDSTDEAHRPKNEVK